MSNAPTKIVGTNQTEKENYILAQLLKLFALCKDHNIYLPAIYRRPKAWPTRNEAKLIMRQRYEFML